MLVAKGLSKRFKDKVVIDQLDFTVARGEVVAVVGENGCGKSTLLKLCAGLLAPDAGTVTLAGSGWLLPPGTGPAPSAQHRRAPRRLRLRARPVRSRRTGAGPLPPRGPRASPTTRIRAVGTLSGGTRQKLNLALALLGQPDVLLLDEPYQGFDHGTYVNFWSLVHDWRDGGKAVVVITHLLGGTVPGGSGGRTRLRASPMSVRRVLTVARLHGLDLIRRRLVLALLAAMPVVIYLAMGDDPFAVVVGGTLMTFSIAGPAVFVLLAGRGIDQRLTLAGYRPLDLVVGRLLLLDVVGLA